MKKEIPPWVFVVAILVVIAVVGWFYQRNNLLTSGSPVEKGSDGSVARFKGVNLAQPVPGER